ncbi:diguanylate cyclase domain-containing protein [Pseudofulvimonas gallinarii]|uniref:diguanylate cyclase domain-containing protein n=1 Tax=Pseudofulvimonas gallinarii TaxID=634155 RepID=UPI0023E8E46B|nr:diguanylate cyclase [Pseudofulvimonas gallinarii]
MNRDHDTLAGPRFSVSASFGVAMAAPSPGGRLDALLIHADIALYCAKSEGRNRVSPMATSTLLAQGTHRGVPILLLAVAAMAACHLRPARSAFASLP